MSVQIIVGTNPAASLKMLKSITEKFDPEVVHRIDASGFDQRQFDLIFNQNDLFSEANLLIVQNPPASLEISDFMLKSKDTIIIVVDKALSASSALSKSARNFNISIADLSLSPDKSIFNFLDLLFEQKPEALGELEKLMNENGDQYILTMIAFGLRRLVYAGKLADFALKKIEKQKKNFSESRLKQIYRELIEADVKIKTGRAEPIQALNDLVSSILFVRT